MPHSFDISLYDCFVYILLWAFCIRWDEIKYPMIFFAIQIISRWNESKSIPRKERKNCVGVNLMLISSTNSIKEENSALHNERYLLDILLKFILIQ